MEYDRMMVDQGYSNKQIIELAGASPSTVVQWKHKYLAEYRRSIAPLESNDVPALQKKITLLEKEISRVKMEKAILKKAAAFYTLQRNRPKSTAYILCISYFLWHPAATSIQNYAQHTHKIKLIHLTIYGTL